MKKQIIAGIIAITCVALCVAVWPRSAEVEDLPAEPIKNALSAEIEAWSEETTHIFISKDVPEPETEIIAKDEPEVTAEPVAESEPQDTEITPEEKIEKPASAGTPKPQVASKSAPVSTEPKPGDRTYIDGEPHVWIPGFGWIKDEGGDNVGTTVGNPGNKLTGNKVGIM